MKDAKQMVQIKKLIGQCRWRLESMCQKPSVRRCNDGWRVGVRSRLHAAAKERPHNGREGVQRVAMRVLHPQFPTGSDVFALKTNGIAVFKFS